MRYIALVLLLWTSLSHALQFPLPAPGNDIVGELQTVTSEGGDTLVSIGQRYDIGAYEMWQANPELPKSTLAYGTRVLIPSQFILPPVRQGIVVNLAELRLYYFPKGQKTVVTFPVGVGFEGWNTPRVSGSVVNKKANPTWYPTPAIRAESAQAGRPLPAVVPPGPDNPMGHYALYLTIPVVRIHGTLRPETVGRRSSHGCIRLFDPDIKYLFHHVPIGTPIHMIYVQDKIGWYNGQLYLQSVIPFPEFDSTNGLNKRIMLAAKGRADTIRWDRVNAIVDDRLGVPEPIN